MFVVIAKSVFLLSAFLFAYHHFVFPYVLQRLAKRQAARWNPRREVIDSTGLRFPVAKLPSVTIIVPVYQEAAIITDKIANLCAINYPLDRLRVVVAFDGCSDNSEQLACAALRQMGNPSHVELLVNEVNQGKLQILNTEIGRAQTDIVALSDASAVFDPDALLRAVAHFFDDRVGIVCPTYRLRYPATPGEEKYWEYQTRLKSLEAAVAAPMGAHGAFYLFRRKTWRPLPERTINDDFALPMQIIADGHRAIYDDQIVAWELERTKARQDFVRRVRIGAGNAQQVVQFRRLLNPWRKPVYAHGSTSAGVAFVFASGKALRVMIPFIVLAGVASCLYLASVGYGMFASIAVSGCIVTALGVWSIMRPGPSVPKLVSWLGYLIEGHVASFVGALNFLLRGPAASWSRSDSSGGNEYIPFGIRTAKRCVDIVFSAVALLLLWPLFIPIAFAIRLETPGPIFYRQRRVGRIWNDRTEIFELIKFRTMFDDAEVREGAQWATKNDPRITAVGRFLRKTRLDELPQFINVLRGDMSLIGPRPERPQLVGGLESKLPLYVERTYGLRPGITGLAQVNQGYDTSIEDVRRKLLYDHAYAAHLSRPLSWLVMDLKIMFGTIWVMLSGRGQ